MFSNQINVFCQGQKQKIFLWLLFSIALLVLAYVLKALGMSYLRAKCSYSAFVISRNSLIECFNMTGIPFSKPLYTLSYTILTAGASGLCLTLIYYIVSTYKFQKIQNNKAIGSGTEESEGILSDACVYTGLWVRNELIKTFGSDIYIFRLMLNSLESLRCYCSGWE